MLGAAGWLGRSRTTWRADSLTLPFVPNYKPLVTGTPRLAIIGEAPGSEEVAQGQPFVGPSGQLLNRLLTKAGIMRATSYIGNVCQFRPPGNELSALPEHGPERTVSKDTLRRELADYKPDLIIALGETALTFLTNHTGISKWRGSLLPANPIVGMPPVRVLPSHHPAYVLRQWSWCPILQMDLKKAALEARTPNKPLPERTFLVQPGFEQAMAVLESLMQAKQIAFDIETVDSKMICLGLAPSPEYAIVIPFLERWSPWQETQLVRQCQRVLENPASEKFAHNAQFDMGVLAFYHGILPANVSMDTMIAHHVCYPELPKALAFLTSVYTREPYYKWEAHQTEGQGEAEWGQGVPREQLYRYNAKDCCVTFECALALQQELTDQQAWPGFKIDMQMLPLAMEMTLRGMGVDMPACVARRTEIEKQVLELDTQLTLAFGQSINTKSPKQMKELLYDKLKLPIQRNAEGTPTANADALLELARQFNLPQIRLLLKNRQARTKVSFFQPDLHPRTGRIHPGFNVAGTETGRWSSAASFLGGRNVMNIPEDCRSIYTADPGMTLVGWDKSAAEARVVAAKAFVSTGNQLYWNVIQGKQKIHVWFGLRLIERKICPQSIDYFLSHATNDNEWYYISKVSVHGFSYDLGPLKWSRIICKETDGEIVVPVAVAKRIKQALYEDLSSIPAWQTAIQAHLRASPDKSMVTAFGRRRQFFSRWGEEMFGEAYAFEPQSTVADDVACCLARVSSALPWMELLQQNYDSILGQVPEARADEALALMKSLVQQPMTIQSFDLKRTLELIIPVSMKVGKNWGEMKEL